MKDERKFKEVIRTIKGAEKDKAILVKVYTFVFEWLEGGAE